MGFEESGHMAGMHRVKSELNGQYDEYVGAYDHSMAGGYAGGYNADMPSFGGGEEAQVAFTGDNTANQLYMDAERMAQLEREFHDQVTRLTNGRPDIEAMMNEQPDPNTTVSDHQTGFHGDIEQLMSTFADTHQPQAALPTDQTSASAKPYPCPICGKMFGRVSHVRRHQLLHTGDKPFKCDVCNERFTRMENRDRHMVIHTKTRPYTCAICQKGFTQLNRLKVHMLIHTGDRPFPCSICEKSFMRLDHLKVHLKMHEKHGEDDHGPLWNRKIRKCSIDQTLHTPQPPVPDAGPIKAEPVDAEPSPPATYLPTPHEQLYPSASYYPPEHPPMLMEALQKPPQPPQPSSDPYADGHDKPYQCPQCPKNFARRDHYNRHILVHSGAKPHECDVCGRSFSRKDNKYSHMANCILKNFGISVEQDQRSQTLENTIEAKMLEIASLIKPRHNQHYRSTANDASAVESTDEDNAHEPPMLPLSVDTTQLLDTDKQYASSPDSVGTLRLRSLDELSDAAPSLLMPTFNEMRAEDHHEDDDDDFVDPSEFLSADLNDLSELMDPTDPLDTNAPKRFECDVCQSQFMHKSHLARHTMLHTGDKPFKCDQCDKTFHRKEHLQRHVVVHRNEAPKSSATLDGSGADVSSETTDSSGDQQAKSFQCEVCQRLFAHKSHLVRHSMLHTGDKPFKCDQCDKGFNRKEHLQRHVIVHTGIKPYKCTCCDHSFYHLHQQVRHMTEEHGDEALVGTTMDGSGAFMDSGEPVLAADNMYHCDRCDKSYAIKFHLKRHYAQHTGEKPFQCEMCDQRFSRSEYKRRHMAIHTNDRRYECEFCERRFIRADHMLAHIKTHEGILPYKCNVCSMRFGTSKEKIDHSRKHTGAYRCEMCLERFELFADLAEHRRDIHLQNDTEKAEILVGRHEHYACPICKKYFSIVALGDHLKSHVLDDGGRAAARESDRMDGDSLESGSVGYTDEYGAHETAMDHTMIKEEMVECTDEYVHSY